VQPASSLLLTLRLRRAALPIAMRIFHPCLRGRCKNRRGPHDNNASLWSSKTTLPRQLQHLQGRLAAIQLGMSGRIRAGHSIKNLPLHSGKGSRLTRAK
jgi:hypothetical protein